MEMDKRELLIEFKKEYQTGDRIVSIYYKIDQYNQLDLNVRAAIVTDTPMRVYEIIQDEFSKIAHCIMTPELVSQFKWNVLSRVDKIADELGIVILNIKKAKVVTDEKEKEFPNSQKWEKFCSTGLLTFVNQFLHIFGWEIVLNIDTKSSKIIGAYPERIHDRRGLSLQTTEQAYENVAKYMKDNAAELIKEAWSSRITVDTKD